MMKEWLMRPRTTEIGGEFGRGVGEECGGRSGRMGNARGHQHGLAGEAERIVGIVEYRDGTIIDVVRARA